MDHWRFLDIQETFRIINTTPDLLRRALSYDDFVPRGSVIK